MIKFFLVIISLFLTITSTALAQKPPPVSGILPSINQTSIGFDNILGDLLIGETDRLGIVSIAIILGGAGLLIMLIYGGFTMLTSPTNPQAQEAGKNTITYAVVGFIILFAAFWIIQLIQIIFGVSFEGGDSQQQSATVCTGYCSPLNCTGAGTTPASGTCEAGQYCCTKTATTTPCTGYCSPLNCTGAGTTPASGTCEAGQYCCVPTNPCQTKPCPTDSFCVPRADGTHTCLPNNPSPENDPIIIPLDPQTPEIPTNLPFPTPEPSIITFEPPPEIETYCEIIDGTTCPLCPPRPGRTYFSCEKVPPFNNKVTCCYTDN